MKEPFSGKKGECVSQQFGPIALTPWVKQKVSPVTAPGGGASKWMNTQKSKNGGYHGVADFRADCVRGNNAAVIKKKNNIHKHGCIVVLLIFRFQKALNG